MNNNNDNPKDYIGDYYDPWKRHYHVIIDLADGNRIDAKVVASSRNQALMIVKRQPLFTDFAGNTDIIAETIEEIPIEPIIESRFAVSKVQNKKLWYAVTDFKNNIMVEFFKHNFNNRQRVLPVGEECKQLNAVQAATALREIGEFMYKNFYEIACKPEKRQFSHYRRNRYPNDANDSFDKKDDSQDDSDYNS